MPGLKLEEVFKTSGVPDYTFVEPVEYPRLVVALRTTGRGVVIEGPSGIGKTTAVETALRSLRLSTAVTKLTARKQADIEYIHQLPNLGRIGTVIIDDFHKLPDETRSALADYLKTLADEEQQGAKLVIIGINNAGEHLIQFAHDLVNRLDIIRFESNPDEKVEELIRKGESALNIDLNVAQDIVRGAQGSFYLAQMLSREVCIKAGILEGSNRTITTAISFESVKTEVWERLGLGFRARCERFCRGAKMKPAGRAPYLQILYWLAHAEQWALSLRHAIRANPQLRGSVSQVVDKGYLEELIDQDPDLQKVVHLDHNSQQLIVEDPQFLFYIRNIPWRKFASDLGFISVEFDNTYDFALSFAGPDRNVAEALFEALRENDLEVFYDKNEQHRILAQDVEEYLKPIYNSEARFVVVLLSQEYPKRIWTKIESDAFKERFGHNAVIPIWFSDTPPTMFDQSRKLGGLEYDPHSPLAPQIEQITKVLVKKVEEARLEEHCLNAVPTIPVSRTSRSSGVD
ncbi:MAG TPA: TIR domain-containing protein [Myxococcota bacterium]|nr:TIR domain-containing protein [Myxococcota bacterium]